jgi:uncharacterized protein YkwD
MPVPAVPSRRRSRVVLLAATAALALLLSACTPESWASFDMINASRAQNGRAPLEFHGDLWFKAQAWADHIAGQQRLSHSHLPDGLHHLPWRKLGENVGVAGSLGGVHNAFMGSTGHRANILDPAFTHTAVGVAGDWFGRYWVVQEFMRL